mmetsp:Transcript_131107/g.298476  ORF Transcript_131107/g.298476 Transcript_131107/m.298476 type:complete len:205 (-) Transcript_131107:52-666(-)
MQVENAIPSFRLDFKRETLLGSQLLSVSGGVYSLAVQHTAVVQWDSPLPVGFGDHVVRIHIVRQLLPFNHEPTSLPALKTAALLVQVANTRISCHKPQCGNPLGHLKRGSCIHRKIGALIRGLNLKSEWKARRPTCCVSRCFGRIKRHDLGPRQQHPSARFCASRLLVIDKIEFFNLKPLFLPASPTSTLPQPAWRHSLRALHG